MSNLIYVFLDNNFYKDSARNPYTYTELPAFYKATYINNKKYVNDSYFITQSKYCFDKTCINVDELKSTPEYNDILDILKTKWTRYIEDPFWFNTTIRVILLLICIIKKDLKDVLHVEADNIIFHDITNLKTCFQSGEFGYSNEAISASAPCCMFIKDKQAATTLLNLHKQLLLKGETELQPYVGHFANYITDMAFLDIIYRRKKDYKMLPCVPYGPFSTNLEHFNMLFDPNPYGMFFFGTNQGHEPGYLEQRHFVGEQILNKTITPKIISNKPVVIYQNKEIPIFNLHMHNKKAIIPFLENAKS